MAFNLTGAGGGAAGGAATGFSIGGPWGAGIGALAGGLLGSGLLGGSGKSPGTGGYGGGPAQAQPLDYGQLMGMANANAAQQVGAQFADQNKYYGQTQGLQLGTIGALSQNLTNDPFTRLAQVQLGKMGNQGNALSSLGGIASQYGKAQLANSGPNSLEQNLYNTANSQLALGSSLSPEDQRAATQGADASWASRGLGAGSSAGAAEILGRYQLGQERLSQRQGAAINADNTFTQNPLARYGAGISGLGQAGSFYGNAGNLYGQGANTAIAIDPYARAINPGIALAGQNLGNSAGIIGQTYAGANNMVGNIASFNANMQDSRYNAYQNNQAALNGAQVGANGQLLGAGIGALGQIGGAYLQGQAGGGGAGLGTSSYLSRLQGWGSGQAPV